MTYNLKEQIPDVKTYIDIRVRAGLSRKSEEAASRGLPNSIYSVIVFYGEIPVGIGRVIGDGGCFYEITDIAVVPEHQKKGVGILIMDTLVKYLRNNAPSTAYVSLMADHGTPRFYEKFGFQVFELPSSARMHLRIK